MCTWSSNLENFENANWIYCFLLAEHLAKEFKIPREAQDEFACKSQNKVEEAVNNGYFEKEIVGVPEKRTGKLINKDEFPRFGTTVEKLAKLKACFVANGTVTPGNSSGIMHAHLCFF